MSEKIDPHYMSAGTVKLNLARLIEVTANAIQDSRCRMAHYQGEIDRARYEYDRSSSDGIYHMNHHMAFNAGRLAESAKIYADAMDTYYHLVEAMNRETVELIRKQSSRQ